MAHLVHSGEAALQQLTDGIQPTLIVTLSNINTPRDGRAHSAGARLGSGSLIQDD
jgi:hypothetical protein